MALSDPDEARRMVELSGFRDSSIGFLLQQACEKALKSWIHSRGGLAPFTHDLVALMDWLEESGTDVSPFERIADLTFFAVQTRYDDSLEITAPDWPLLLGVSPPGLARRPAAPGKGSGCQGPCCFMSMGAAHCEDTDATEATGTSAAECSGSASTDVTEHHDSGLHFHSVPTLNGTDRRCWPDAFSALLPNR
ncbi:HEPN domain-containing protein [Cyanobium sp. Cruz-8H5]|uniref:HEPN domain-containing protein n=1 Tax=Cyanobium sp. Cruz-8H5 TaxID=2823712 RepID=UPI0020CF378C|nr:HEPN domain-containing protein [Cyanobium sp. Cruz-8H5]